VPLTNVEPLINLSLPSFEDSQGNLWGFESRGLDLLREVDGRTVPQLFELNVPGSPGDGLKATSFRDGSDGSFWIGTNWGLVHRLTSGRIVHYSVQPHDGLDTVRAAALLRAAAFCLFTLYG
jgi:ligand-binding sensor domain-containing protein